MRKNFLLFTLFSGFLYVSLSSSSSGPAHDNKGNRTGSPGSAGTCASSGCHTGSGTINGGISLRKKSTGISGPTVSTYDPNEEYIVTLTASGTSKPAFGFQVVAFNELNQSIGTFSNFPAHVGTATGSGATVVEHTSPLPGGPAYSVSFDWKAPATGTGNVTFYGILNGVDGTGSTNNDVVSAPFQTAIFPTSVANIENKVEVKTYPNPFHNTMEIKMANAASGTYNVNVFDLTGRKIYHADMEIDGKTSYRINTEKWASGMYHIQISKDDVQYISRIVKQ